MESRLERQIEQQSNAVETRLSQLETRLSELERKSEKESQQQMKLIERKGQAFAKSVEKLKMEMEGEKKSRLVQDSGLVFL